MSKEVRTQLTAVDGGRGELKREMFETLVFGEPDAWRPIAERLLPRVGHLTEVSPNPSDAESSRE